MLLCALFVSVCVCVSSTAHPTSKAWLLWNSTYTDVEYSDLIVGPAFPKWLKGDLIRNGCGRWDVGEQKYNHWFDGFPKVHKWNIDNGNVTFMSKFLTLPLRTRSLKENKIRGATYGTPDNPPPDYPLTADCGRAEDDDTTSTTTTDPAPKGYALMTATEIARIGPLTMAATDGALQTWIDPETLATLAPTYTFNDTLGNAQYQFECAHSHTASNGDFYNLITEITAEGYTESVYRVKNDGYHKREILGTYKTGFSLGFKHSFAITPNYVIFFDQPATMSMMPAFEKKPAVCTMKWNPHGATTFRALNLATGVFTSFAAESPFPNGEAFMGFHQINAYEDGDDLVVDVCNSPDGNIFRTFYLDLLRNHPDQLYGNQSLTVPYRWRLPIKKGLKAGEKVKGKLLMPKHLELPQMNYYKYNGLKYTWTYGVSFNSSASHYWDQLIKLNVDTGVYKAFMCNTCYFSEPVFAESPNPKAEDDGVILSQVLDATKEKSFLLVLDASTFTEIDRVWLPTSQPADVHGVFRYPGGGSPPSI